MRRLKNSIDIRIEHQDGAIWIEGDWWVVD